MPFEYDLSELDGEVTVQEGKLGNWIKQMEKYLGDEMEVLWNKQLDLSGKYENFDDEEIIFHKSSMFFYIKKDKKSIGYAVCTPGHISPLVWISSFYIRKEYRSKGIGSKSLVLLKGLLSKKGYSRIALSVNALNKPAEHIYKENGFTTEVTHTLLCKL